MGPHREPVKRILGASGTPNRTKRRVSFVDCSHTGEFESPWPTKGQTVYCRRCHDYRIVEEELHDYRAFCHEGARCLKRSSYGSDLLRARLMASEHVMMHPTHRVEVMDNWQPLEAVQYGDVQEELPFAFLADERDRLGKLAQKNLRSALDKVHAEREASHVPPHGGTDGHQEGPQQ